MDGYRSTRGLATSRIARRGRKGGARKIVFNGAEHHPRCLSGKKVLIVETPPGSVAASDEAGTSSRCCRSRRGLAVMGRTFACCERGPGFDPNNTLMFFSPHGDGVVGNVKLEVIDGTLWCFLVDCKNILSFTNNNYRVR